MATETLEHLIDERAAAAALGVRVATMRAWRLNGRGPTFVKVGRCVRYKPSVLAQFVSDGARVSTADTGQGARELAHV
jgi:hypothetical protein